MTNTALPGIEAAGLPAFFARHFDVTPGTLVVELIGGGRSNLTYRLTSGDQTWVLRRPPLGHVLPTAHDMAREHRVLSALSSAGFAAPRPLVFCGDERVIGAPFYVMDFVDGVLLDKVAPPGYIDTPERRARLSEAVVRTLAALHSIEPDAIGLDGFGRPAGFIERQVRRWSEQWERSKTREVPAFAEVRRRLEAALPSSQRVAIVHGDYRLGNILHDPADPGRIAAVLDWEMSTLGDPLFDLAYLLMHWSDPGDSPARIGQAGAGELTLLPGFLTRAELAAEYAKASGLDLAEMAFYEVLSFFKHAVITEGIHARHLAGETVGPGFESTDGAASLLELALAAADSSPDPRLRGVVP